MTITKQTHKNLKTGKEYTQYIVDLGKINGKRERYSFSTKEKAQEWLRTYKRQQTKYGSLTTALTPTQFALAAEAFQKLAKGGLNDTCLADAVELFLERNKAAVESISFGEAYRLYVSTFDASQQKAHLDTIRATVGKVLQFYGEDYAIDLFTPNEIEKYFGQLEKSKSPKTYNNALNYTKSFFNWCVTRKHIKTNPVELTTKRIAYKDPEFIKVEDLRGILRLLDTNAVEDLTPHDRHALINFITLSFFCGIRTSEIARLTPDAIHPEDERPYVRISTTKGAARGIKGRIVDLEPNAAEWLKKYPFVKMGEQTMDKVRARLKKLKTADCFSPIFVQNVGRHSYITYHTAKYRDYARTEAYVGTSAGMRTKHYQGLATTASGEAYFSVFPE